jgi:hypothetical protein
VTSLVDEISTASSHNSLHVFAKMSSNVFASTFCAIVISCTWVLSAFASEASWSFVLDFKAEGTTQNKSLSLGEWGRAGCTYSPAPAICYETILIDTRVYFDDKINRRKNGRLLWVLFDYSQRSNQNDQSNTHYLEIDCERWAYLELAKYGYVQPMGKGSAEVKTNLKDWNYPPPNTAFLKILQAACKR